jgi:competence protein ComEA
MTRSLRQLSVAVLLLITVSGTALLAQEGQDGPEQAPAELVDINSAPVEQIQMIVESEAVATRIVEGRPYANKRQLVSRELVSEEQYESIKDRIIARQPRPAPQTP